MNLKKNKLLSIVVVLLIVIEIGTMFLMYKSLNSKSEKIDEVILNKVEKNMFAVLLEQADGSYLEVDTWPNEGYIYDKGKSGCMDENGNKLDGSLTFDSDNNVVTLETGKTSYCYLYFKKGDRICTLSDDSSVAAGEYGAKYNCKVDPNKNEYTFYLLNNNEDGTSDLIMNANINVAGEAVSGVDSDNGVYWDEIANYRGPVTSMTYLYNATKSWSNVEPLNYEYYDRDYQGITDPNIGYESFVSVNGIATIKDNTGAVSATIGTEIEPLRVRMPIYHGSEDYQYIKGEITPLNENNSFLYENGSSYWMLSSFPYASELGFYTSVSGYVMEYPIWDGIGFGVRPIINVSL